MTTTLTERIADRFTGRDCTLGKRSYWCSPVTAALSGRNLP